MKSMAISLEFFLFLAVALPNVALADSHEARVSGNAVIPFLSPRELQKITIGEVEDVMLVPWTVTLPARIDTGATLSSLDARDVTVRNNIADFTLGKKYGGLRLRLPVVDWVRVRTSAGAEERPVVRIGVCLGSRLVRAVATLRDRSQMTYPFLVGRNVLKGSFVVDPSRAKTVHPACLSRPLSEAR